MRLTEAIRIWCGVRVAMPPEDGQIRWFRIDALRNGFMVTIGGRWMFGSIIDGIMIMSNGERRLELEYEHRRSKKIAFEWCVWEAGRVAVESGSALSSDDADRLSLAVKRLEAWL